MRINIHNKALSPLAPSSRILETFICNRLLQRITLKWRSLSWLFWIGCQMVVHVQSLLRIDIPIIFFRAVAISVAVWVGEHLSRCQARHTWVMGENASESWFSSSIFRVVEEITYFDFGRVTDRCESIVKIILSSSETWETLIFH